MAAILGDPTRSDARGAQVRRAAGKLWMENQKAVLARITDLATQDQPSDMVACQQNDIDNRIEEEGCEKKTKKMKTQPA